MAWIAQDYRHKGRSNVISLTWDIINFLQHPSDPRGRAESQFFSGGGGKQGKLVAAMIRFLRFRAERRQAVSAADVAEAHWALRLEDAVSLAVSARQDCADGESNSGAKMNKVDLYNLKVPEAAELDVMLAKAELRRAVRLVMFTPSCPTFSHCQHFNAFKSTHWHISYLKIIKTDRIDH
jgi:hypothetical protein